MDVRSLRGKFDEMKEKTFTLAFVELEIFLEIHLIYFTNRSKVKFQREKT